MKKVGRNDICPCGSSKKYKKCHYLIKEIVEPQKRKSMGIRTRTLDLATILLLMQKLEIKR